MREKIYALTMTALTALLVLSLLVWVAGCAPIVETKYITTELHHDPRPVLPRIGAEELQCLTPQTTQKLYDKYRLVTGYAITLEAIIDSTKSPEPIK